MALTDWIGEGHCTEVDFDELDKVGEYHPEASEYYRVESFIVEVEGGTSYISCKASPNWSGNAAQLLNSLKLYEQEDPVTKKNFLLATDITTRDIDGWTLTQWRIDIIEKEEKGSGDKGDKSSGEIREMFQDKLTWSFKNTLGASAVPDKNTLWLWDNGYWYLGTRRVG